MKKAGPDALMPEEMERIRTLWKELKDTGGFATAVEREIIAPNLARINAALGTESDAKSLAETVELYFVETHWRPPGSLWEWVDDVCLVCEARIGRQVRWLCSGLCDRCAKAPKH